MADYVSLTEAAVRLGLSPSTLRVAKNRNPKGFPSHAMVVGGQKIYRFQDLEKFVQNRVRKNARQTGTK